MNTENGPLIALLVIGIIIVANGLMLLAAYSAVRGGKNKPNSLGNAQDMFRKPFNKENASLDELRKRVEELERKE